MKLKYNFDAINMDEEIISVPIGEEASKVHGVLKSNNSGQEIIKMLEEETTEEMIVDALAAKYEDDRTTLKNYVDNVLNVLRKAGLLSE